MLWAIRSPSPLPRPLPPKCFAKTKCSVPGRYNGRDFPACSQIVVPIPLAFAMEHKSDSVATGVASEEEPAGRGTGNRISLPSSIRYTSSKGSAS